MIEAIAALNLNTHSWPDNKKDKIRPTILAIFPIIPLKNRKSEKQQYREGVFLPIILLKSCKSGKQQY